MNETTLEFTVAIKADEATLRDIHDRLTNTTSDRIALTDLLTDWLSERLIVAGVTKDFRIELHPDHMITHYPGGEGLSAREWVEAEELSHHYSDSQDDLPDNHQDYPLYSD
jgi:hypothetical protein